MVVVEEVFKTEKDERKEVVGDPIRTDVMDGLTRRRSRNGRGNGVGGLKFILDENEDLGEAKTRSSRNFRGKGGGVM